MTTIDRVDIVGNVSLRMAGRLRHTGVGGEPAPDPTRSSSFRTYAGA